MENVRVLLAKLGIAFLGLSRGIHLMQGWCLRAGPGCLPWEGGCELLDTDLLCRRYSLTCCC